MTLETLLLQTMPTLASPSLSNAVEELALLDWDRGAEVITEYGEETRQDGVMEREERTRVPFSSPVTKFQDRQEIVTAERALAGQTFLQLVPGPGRCLSVLQLARAGLRECRGLEELEGVMQVSEAGGCGAVNLPSPSWTCPTTSSPCCPRSC